MIGENITNNKIRTAYFNNPERKKAIEKLILIGNQTQLNEYQKVNIKIYSDNDDISAINSGLRQVELESIPIAFTNPKLFSAEEDTILVLQIDSLASGLLAEVALVKKRFLTKLLL